MAKSWLRNLWLPLFLTTAIARAAEASGPAGTDEPAGSAPQDARMEAVLTQDGASDVLVLPGIIADRKRKRIEVQAKTTALAPSDIVEFFLIGPQSGHGYEALAVAACAPSDIHRALEFIGMQPGLPAEPRILRFWPKGERVLMSFLTPTGGLIRVEELVYDGKNGKTLPLTGLVFTGSSWQRGGDTGGVYRADVYEPHSIASTYNEEDSVLDLPQEAAQSAVYGRFRAADGIQQFPSNSLISVILEPEYKDGKQRVREMVLSVRLSGTSVVGRLSAKNAGSESRDLSLDALETELKQIAEGGHTVWLALGFDDAMPLLKVREVCAILAALDLTADVRIEPPSEKQLCYRAFLPKEKFRDRAGRIEQPCELRLRREGAAVTGVLTRVQQKWPDDAIDPILVATDYPVRTPEELRQALDRMPAGLPVILVFADSELTHGELLSFVEPVRSTHPTVHVFLESPASQKEREAAASPGQ